MAKFVNKTRNVKDTAFSTFDLANTLVGSLSSLTSNKGHVLIGCNVANTHTATITVDVALITDGSPDTIAYIAKDVAIPSGGNVELVDGKIVIDSDSTKIHARCSIDTKADIIVSVLENA